MDGAVTGTPGGASGSLEVSQSVRRRVERKSGQAYRVRDVVGLGGIRAVGATTERWFGHEFPIRIAFVFWLRSVHVPALGSVEFGSRSVEARSTCPNALNFSLCEVNAREGAFIDLRSLGNFWLGRCLNATHYAAKALSANLWGCDSVSRKVEIFTMYKGCKENA